jgi:hypothetical protein
VLYVSLFVNGAVGGMARLSTDVEQATRAAGLPAEQAGAGYAETLESLIDADRFPTLQRMVSAGAFRPAPEPGPQSAPDVNFGLRRLLDGIETYVEARAARDR